MLPLLAEIRGESVKKSSGKTLSEQRAEKAQEWVNTEIEKLLSIMHEVGLGKSEHFKSKADIQSLRIEYFSNTKVQTTFGDLFRVYQHVSVSCHFYCSYLIVSVTSRSEIKPLFCTLRN